MERRMQSPKQCDLTRRDFLAAAGAVAAAPIDVDANLEPQPMIDDGVDEVMSYE